MGENLSRLKPDEKEALKQLARSTGNIYRAARMAKSQLVGLSLFALEARADERGPEAMAKRLVDAGCDIQVTNRKDPLHQPSPSLLLIQVPEKNFKLATGDKQCPAKIEMEAKLIARGDVYEGKLAASYTPSDENFAALNDVTSFSFEGNGVIRSKGDFDKADYEGEAEGSGKILSTQFGTVGVTLLAQGQGSKTYPRHAFAKWVSAIEFRFPGFTAVLKEAATYLDGDLPAFSVELNGEVLTAGEYEDLYLESIAGKIHDWYLFYQRPE